ncbi:MAG: phage tail fiber protein, partial [Nitrospiraceae bacterium]
MPLSFVQYTADGVTDTFNIPFGYLSKTDIQVRVDNVLDASVTFPTASTVQTSSMPANGAIVEVKRVTPNTTRVVDFQDGSLLSEVDLDQSALQNFYVMQELYDDLGNKLGLNSANVFDAQNKKIINLALATDSLDAANKQYVDNVLGTWAPKDASYLTLAANGSLTSERILTPGTGLTGNDGGAGSAYTLALSIPVSTAHGGTGLTAIGTANQMLGVNNAANGLEYKTLTAGSGISVSHGAGTVTVNSTITQYTDEMAQDAVGGMLSDTATIDATYNDAGASITLDLKDNSVSNAKLRDSSGLSIIGRSANSIGYPADITAGSDGDILRRSGSTLGFGSVPFTSVTGLGALADKNTVGTSDVDNDAVSNTKLRDSGGLSVIGRSANSSGDPADITAGSDGDILRRSGTTLGFGTILSTSVTGLGSLATQSTIGTSDIDDEAVTFDKVQDVSSQILLGRSTAGSGEIEEITLGTGLSLDAGELSATGGGGGGGAPTDATYITQTPSAGLSDEQALSDLATGLVKVTTGTGVLSSVPAPTGDVVGTTDTQTLTNKKINPRVVALTSGTTVNTDASAGDLFTLLLAEDATMAAPT